MMKRDECLRLLVKRIADDIVVGAYSTAFDWISIRPDHPLNYMSVGAMGLASSHGLGLALACPERRVVVLDGDGSLLMNLGSLVTIATVAPRNFVHCVSVNGNYEANGGHPIPGRDVISFAAVAKGAGYRNIHEFSELTRFEAGIGLVLEAEGPTFVVLNVERGAEVPLDYGKLYAAETRVAFRNTVLSTARQTAKSIEDRE
jgi:sulfopyruvate decarboxylase subunit beta